MGKKQELIDITFQIAMTVANNAWFVGKTNEQIAVWVANQLRKNGFDTQPVGSSWGVLRK